MRKSSVYICKTGYHLLIAMLKAYNTTERISILLGKGFPRMDETMERLKKNKRIDNCYRINNLHINYLFPLNEYSYYRYLDSFKYIFQNNVVYLFNDSDVEGRYLRYRKIHYVLVEDGCDSFKMDYFSRVEEKSVCKIIVYKFLGIEPSIADKKNEYIKYLEVNNEDGIINKHDYSVECIPRMDLVQNLTDDERDCIISLFITDNLVAEIKKIKEGVLIITQPFFADGILESMEDQIMLYKMIIKGLNLKNVVIKPHPRDVIKYHRYFPEAVIIEEGQFPLEIIDLMGEIIIEKAVTVSSTAINSLKCIKDKVVLGEEYLEMFKDDKSKSTI